MLKKNQKIHVNHLEKNDNSPTIINIYFKYFIEN